MTIRTVTIRAEAQRRPARKAAARAPAKRAAKSPTRGEAFRLTESPSHLLRRAEQFAADMFARSELLDGVTLRQSVLLAAIAESEGASQSDLVRMTGVDRSTLAEMMARMERRGLIARAAARDDGRAKSVRLTAQGRRRLDSAVPAMRDVDKALLAAVPAANRALFRTLLVSLAEAADRALAETEEAAAPKKPAAPVRNKPVARAAAAVRKKARNKR
jgi:DNA-binding MarR family transcriptional regulator